MPPSENQVSITVVPGNTAPRYPNGVALKCEKAIVTEQATNGRLPIVDFLFASAGGPHFVYTATGRIIRGIGSVVDGIIARVHPQPERREMARQIAIAAAAVKKPSYYAEPFEPHEWVIDAIEHALAKGESK